MRLHHRISINVGAVFLLVACLPFSHEAFLQGERDYEDHGSSYGETQYHSTNDDMLPTIQSSTTPDPITISPEVTTTLATSEKSHPSSTQISEATFERFSDLQALICNFTNTTSASLNFSKVAKSLDLIEKSIGQVRLIVENDQNKLDQLIAIEQKIKNVRILVHDMDIQIQSLVQGGAPVSLGVVRRQEAWATLYRGTGHAGRAMDLDFRSCNVLDECCKNMNGLEKDTQSINTHGYCVRMFKGKDCAGDFRDYYPGSPTSHADFGSFSDTFSSGKPCLLR